LTNKITLVILGLIILIISGCLQSPKEKEMATPNATALPTAQITVVATSTPTPSITPKELPSNTLYVNAQILKPVFWGPGKYELKSLKVDIYNQARTSLLIKAQIISNDQVLEERSFVISGEGNSYQFTNDRQHYINSTNVTLRLLVQDYQPVEYRFIEVDILS
jgi:hypothetical protein